jgi:beta-lactamase superfamily II metal-dependent hydrolase
MLTRVLDIVGGVLVFAALGLGFAGCGDDDPADPGPQAPAITISGVEEGVVYTEPVTILISVDVGTYTAELNGDPFQSGGTVEDIGTYTLEVVADNQGAMSNETVNFGITLSGERIIIVRMLDLGASELDGGGDAILLADSSSLGVSYALIDAGSAGPGGADSTAVADRLQELGVESLEALILSHGLGDHYFGIPAVLDAVEVKRFLSNGQESNDNRYKATIAAAELRADTAVVVDEPYTREISDPGSPVITVLDPFPAFLGNAVADDSQLQEGSLGTWVAFGDYTLFFAGDGLTEANNRWRNTYPQFSVNAGLLKVGHHGGNDAIFNNPDSDESVWLNHTSPRIAFISANGSSHPEPDALTEILDRDIETYCTNVHGEVVIRANREGQYIVDVERNEGQACTAGSEAAPTSRP